MIVFFYTIVFSVSLFDNSDNDSSENDNIRRISFSSSFDSLNILFIGNSYTYSGIIPEKINDEHRRSYNLGIATAGPYFYKIIIEDYLESARIPPDTIFLLVTPMTFSKKSDNFIQYPIHRYLNKPFLNEEIVVDFNKYYSYPGLLRKSVSKGIANISHHKKSVRVDSSMYYAMGYKYDSASVSQSLITSTEHLYKDLESDKFDRLKFLFLRNYAAKLRRRNINVIFYELPTYKLWNYFSNEFKRDYETSLLNLNEDYHLIRIDLPSDSSYYRNLDHLNHNGAKIVSQILRNKMRDLN